MPWIVTKLGVAEEPANPHGWALVYEEEAGMVRSWERQVRDRATGLRVLKKMGVPPCSYRLSPITGTYVLT